MLSVLQSNQRHFSELWLFVSFSLLFDLTDTIPHWWQSTATAPFLKVSSVCYDDGITPVAKITEKEILITVRESQSLSRHVCACTCASSRIHECVVASQQGWWGCTPLIREDYHLLEHILFLFALPSACHRTAHYSSWMACSRAWLRTLCARVFIMNSLLLMDRQKSISWVDVWNQSHRREERNRTEELASTPAAAMSKWQVQSE